MFSLAIGNLTARLPIIQGGMGVGISLSNLSSAVAEEGGIGVISVAGIGLFEKDSATHYQKATHRALIREIQHAKQKTKGIIGVNVMVALTNFEELIQIAISENVDVVFVGAGLPLNVPALLPENSQTKIVPIVSSARAAALICRKWQGQYNYLPEAIVIEGPLAGGHLGFKLEQINDPAFALEKLLPEVRAAINEFTPTNGKPISLIVGGGVYTGADILKFKRLGADGVQMGTRFVTTHECDASIEFKNSYLKAGPDDMTLISSPVGLPGRAVSNSFLDKVKRGEKHPINCHFHCLKTCNYQTAPYCILQALLNAAKGKLDYGFSFGGSNAYLATKIKSVKETIDEIKSEYELALLAMA